MELKTIDSFKEKAKENLIKDGWVMPIVALEERNTNRIGIIGFTYDDKKGEEQMKQLIREKLLTGGFESFLTIQEIWYVEGKAMDKGIRPSQHKDKKEAIFIAYQNDIGRKKAYIIPFKRDGEKITFEEERTSDKIGGFESVWK